MELVILEETVRTLFAELLKNPRDLARLMRDIWKTVRNEGISISLVCRFESAVRSARDGNDDMPGSMKQWQYL